jgi:Phosphotransferase enzyme family
LRGRIRTSGAHVFKRYANREQASLAVARAEQLLAGGVPTPRALLHRQGRMVMFPRIAGRSGRDISTQDIQQVASLLLSVVKLHALNPLPALPVFDPLAKITARSAAGLDPGLCRLIDGALEVISRSPKASCVVHGDLHVGQFVLGSSETAWLVDLDDMALGDSESDLGNFAAHLVTRTFTTAPIEAMRQCLAESCDSYARAGGRVDMELADAYGRIALVRRAMKQREHGSDTLRDQLIGHIRR